MISFEVILIFFILSIFFDVNMQAILTLLCKYINFVTKVCKWPLSNCYNIKCCSFYRIFGCSRL